MRKMEPMSVWLTLVIFGFVALSFWTDRQPFHCQMSKKQIFSVISTFVFQCSLIQDMLQTSRPLTYTTMNSVTIRQTLSLHTCKKSQSETCRGTDKCSNTALVIYPFRESGTILLPSHTPAGTSAKNQANYEAWPFPRARQASVSTKRLSSDSWPRRSCTPGTEKSRITTALSKRRRRLKISSKARKVNTTQ